MSDFRTEVSVTIGALTSEAVDQSGPCGEFVYIDISSVDRETKTIADPKTLTLDQAPSRAKQVLKAGDVLVSMTRPNLNAVALVPAQLDGAIGSTGFHVLRSRWLKPEFLFALVQTRDFIDAMTEVVQGALYPAVRPRDIGAYSFAFETPLQQTRIVEKIEELLSDLDAGVAELKAAQKKLAQYRQSLLKAAVEGALSAEWRQQHPSAETGAQLLQRILTERRARWEAKQLAKFKEQGKTPPKDWQKKYPEPVQPDTSGLPELPLGWFYADLETLLPTDDVGTKTGPFGSLLKKHEHVSTGVPVVGIENIDRMQFAFGSKIHITLEKAKQLADYDLLTGDVVISRSGTVGEVCVVPSELGTARFSTNIMRVRLDKSVMDPQYFCALFSGAPEVLHQVSELCSGSTRDFLNTEILRSLVFPVPPLAEQQAILSAWKSSADATEELRLLLSRSMAQSIAQRQNILRAAFAGQLVPQDPDDEPASVLLERIRAERAAHKTPMKPRGRPAKEAA